MFGTLIASFATGQMMASVQRLKRALIAFSVVALCLLTGVIFLLVAGTIWLSRQVGSLEATLIIGGAFVALAVIVLVVHKVTDGVRTKAVRRRRNRDVQKAAMAAGIAILPTLLSGRAGRAALLAPAIGALAYALYRENSAGRSRRNAHDDS